MADSRVELNRKLIGFAALSFLAGGLISVLLGYSDEIFTAGLVRNGLFLGALWLALPSNKRPAAWEDISWSTIVLGFLVVIGFLSARFRWTTIPIVLGIAIAMYLLKRPWKRK